MEDAIHLEVERQIEVLESGGTIAQETRLYNGDTGESRSMRSKEEANDYRYFPCPDLLPVEVTKETIEAIRATLPEMPDVKKARFIADYELPEYDADILSSDSALSNYFELCVKSCGDAKLSANWVMGDVSSLLNKNEININSCPISAENLAGLIKRISDGSISGKIAKKVFEHMWAGEGDADTVIDAQGLKQNSDEGALEAMVDEVITNNPKQVENYRNAEPDKRKKMTGFFVGQIMKASKGQANPGLVNKLLMKKLNG